MIQGSQFVFEHTKKCLDKKQIFLDGFYHELLQEPLEDRQKVYKGMVEWFTTHCNK